MAAEAPRLPWVTELFANLAKRAGLAIDVEPEWGYAGRLSAADGQTTCFVGTRLDVNPAGAAALVTDKAFAAHFISRLGYPVPEGKTFFSDPWCRHLGSHRTVQWACGYAETLGFPVVVKPNSRSGGAGVAIVSDADQLREAAEGVFSLAQDRVALVQRFVAGDDYRVLLFDGHLVAAYRRSAPVVTGDGRRTAAELLSDSGLHGVDALDRARRTLRREGIELHERIAEGRKVSVLDSTNLSSGGTTQDVTSELTPEFVLSLTRLASALNLRLCGIDLITSEPLDRHPREYWVIEVNAAPEVTGFAALGEHQHKVAIDLYERIFTALTSERAR